MADVTGGTPPTNASAFAVPADLSAVYAHFGGPSMFAVATAGSLPASGNWEGRRMWVTDVKRFYVWSTSWLPQPVIVYSVASATTDSIGDITVTHGLGGTPTSVVATVADDTPTIGHLLKVNTHSFTSTTFKIRFHRIDVEAAYGLNGVKAYWFAGR
jgi:hypothetical protein